MNIFLTISIIEGVLSFFLIACFTAIAQMASRHFNPELASVDFLTSFFVTIFFGPLRCWLALGLLTVMQSWSSYKFQYLQLKCEVFFLNPYVVSIWITVVFSALTFFIMHGERSPVFIISTAVIPTFLGVLSSGSLITCLIKSPRVFAAFQWLESSE